MKVYWLHLKEHINPYLEGYIGISTQVHIRFQAHLRGSKKTTSRKLHKIITENGKEAILCDVLFEGTPEECVAKEIAYRPHKGIGWNTHTGGTVPPNNLGKKRSEETRRKISESNKGKICGPSPFKGMTNRFTPEQRKLIGSYHKGKTISEAHKQACRDKLSRGKSPVASKVNLYHTDKPNEVIKSYECLMDCCDDIHIGYSAIRSQLRRITKVGKEEFLLKAKKSGYFVMYIGEK